MARNKTDLEKQPQSIEAEEAVLGSMLTSKEAVSKVIQWIRTADCFYKDVHAKIFSCMLALEKQGEPIDSVSVAERLKKEKKLKSVGGAYFITGLSQSVPTTANVEHYTKIVLEKYILRQLIEVSNEVSKTHLMIANLLVIF
jgi:Replicative DNA helicase